MARRYHEIKGLAEYTAKTIVSDEEQWKKFLHTAGQHMNVVICDDDEKDIDRIAELLKKYGLEHTVHFDVNSYKSGEELLSDLLKGSIADIYFLDINMDRQVNNNPAERYYHWIYEEGCA